MVFQKNIFLFLLASFVLPEKNSAFLSRATNVGQTNLINNAEKKLLGYNDIVSAKSGSIDDELEDLDKARTSFERLMKSEETSFLIEFEQVSNASNDPNKPPMNKEDYVPFLTESSRHRCEIEMKLLESLATSDEAVEELVHFWLVERDQESAKKMKEMEQFCSPGHEREEAFLLNIIKEYEYHWVEPISRLALLYYADGRCADCEHWCKVALAVKPWHFEVVQTLIMNAMKQQDQKAAQKWLRQALPPLEDTDSRNKWVERALNDANDAIDRATHTKQAAIKNVQRKRKAQSALKYKTVFSDDTWQ